MAEDNRIHMPAGFGGLMRYDEEYSSILNLKPTHVVVFIVFIIALRIVLPMIF